MEYMSIAIGVIAAIAMAFVFSYSGFGPDRHIAECYSKGGVAVRGYSADGRAAFGCYDIKDLEIK